MSISKSLLALCLSWFLFHWKIGFAIASTYMAINSPVLPTSQYNSLWSLYNATDGVHWKWKLPEQEYGSKWKFNDSLQNPCSSNWQGVMCICSTQMCNITALELPDYGLAGSIPASMDRLWNLEYFDLSNNNLEGSIPASLGNLLNMVNVDLSYNDLEGSIPASLGNLLNMVNLDLSVNHLGGSIPASLGNMSNLVSLDLSVNHLEGSIPASLGNLSKLVYLFLSVNNLGGSIPASLGNLSNLLFLYLSLNHLEGSIPESLGKLSAMLILRMPGNYLDGSIPSSLSNMSYLTNLAMSDNHFEGSIPESLGELSNLVGLQINNNHLTGSIPAALGKLSKLKDLFLFANLLEGIIPASLGNLSNLLVLRMSDNHLEGTIPASLGNMKNISILYLSNNHLVGTIPASLGELSNLIELSLNNNMLGGVIPVSIAFLSKLQSLRLDNNMLVGNLPVFGQLSAIVTFECQNNSLVGDIVFSKETLLVLNLANNFFGSESTSRIWLPPSLQYLNLSGNVLSGPIEAVVNSSLRSLVSIDLSYNRLTGFVGTMFAGLSNLSSLVLAGNQLKGNLGQLVNGASQPKLTSIDVSDNMFTGSIPTDWFFPSNMSSIAVTSNCLTGGLPETVCSASNLVTLVLDGMGSATKCNRPLFGAWTRNIYVLSGRQQSLYSCLFEMLSHLQTLHLSGINMKGSLPAVTTLPSTLQYLSLANNHLTGSIPTVFYSHDGWVEFDVSFNRLTGELHDFVSSNASLKMVQNRISGSIPASIVNMNDVSVLSGNMYSCGYIEHGNELPQSDSASDSYECGSNQVDMLLFGWLCLLTATLLLVVACLWRYTGDVVVRIREEARRVIYSDTISVQRIVRTSLAMTVSAVCLLLPMYCILKIFYGTYYHQYAYEVSSGYISGVVPCVLLLMVYWCLIGFCVSMLRPRDISSRPTESRKATDVQAWIWFVLIVLLSAAATIVVNAMYVYAIVMHVSVAVDFALVGALAVLKLLFNNALLHLPVGTTEVMTLSLTALLCFNNVVVPYLGEAFVSGNCFLYATFQAAPDVTSSIAVQTCGIWLNSELNVLDPSLPSSYTGCVLETKNISYQPPFIYNFSCSASLLSNFVGVFIVRFVLSGNVMPLLQWTAFRYLQSRRETPRNGCEYVLYKMMMVMEDKRWTECRRMDAIAKTSSIELLDDFVRLLPIHSVYDHRKLVSSLLSDMFVLLSFGVMYPPLAVVICISILVHVGSQQLVLSTVEKYVSQCSTEVQDTFRRRREEETAWCVYMMRRPLPVIIWLTAAFWSYSLFDTMGDAVGMARASSVVVVMCLCPFFWYGVLWLLDKGTDTSLVMNKCSDTVSSSVVIENPLLKNMAEVEMSETYVASSSDTV